MPQLQPVIVKDRAATPVNHTFTPQKIEANVAVVAESSGIPIGDNRISLSQTRNGSGKYKATVKGVFPIVQSETINGITTPRVVRTSYVDASFTFDASSTEQERNNVVGMFADLMGPTKVLFHDTVVKLEGIY